MKIKGLIIGVLMLVFFSMPVFAGYVDNFTRDSHIREALVLLENNGASEVFDNLEENSVKIAFYDLSQISFGYMNHFAVNTVIVFCSTCDFSIYSANFYILRNLIN